MPDRYFNGRFYNAVYIRQHFYSNQYCEACRWRMAYEAISFYRKGLANNPGLLVAARKMIESPQPEHVGSPCNYPDWMKERNK